MDDLISRQAVSSWLKQYGQDVLHGKYKFSLMYIWKSLMDLPSVQPETATVTRGRTKGEMTLWYECDACGETVDENDNYCSNCGRKLKHE